MEHIRSWYAASAHPAPLREALRGETTADVCVVGGGIAGCSTALHLAERGYRVVLLEGRRIAWGASGRSGGQAIFGFAAGQDKLEAQVGREAARRMFDVSVEALDLLKERVARDILPMAQHFLQQALKAFDLPLKDLSKDVEKALLEYDWPGNVRELENAVKRAAILSKGSIIERRDLFATEHPSWSIQEFLAGKLVGFLTRITTIERSTLYDTVISEVEKAPFGIVLKETGGNQVRAAKILGINRNTLNKKVKEYRLQ